MSESPWTAWLIERRDDAGHASWLSRIAEEEWTTDALDALHFARRRDAEVFVEPWVDDDEIDLHITEHQFG